VLYVMGAGRSGSTILGVTLGNCDGVFYAGELDAWLARSGEPLLDDPERVAFWSALRAHVEGAQELFGREAQVSIERSLSLLRVHKWRARRRLRARYRRVAESLYRAIAAATDGAVVVDTSHYPMRARELQAVDGIDLHLIYLSRNPHSVVHSFNRTDVAQYNKATLTTNVYLWLTNLVAMYVFLRQPRERRLFLRYEDFVADPSGVLGELLEQVQLSELPPDMAALRTGLAFQGNRLLRSPVIALERGASPPASSSPLTALLQLPWMLALGRLRPVAGRRRARGERALAG
jgi:hypothetical protein